MILDDANEYFMLQGFLVLNLRRLRYYFVYRQYCSTLYFKGKITVSLISFENFYHVDEQLCEIHRLFPGVPAFIIHSDIPPDVAFRVHNHHICVHAYTVLRQGQGKFYFQ